MELKPTAIMILLVLVVGTLMLGTLAATGNAQESNDTVRIEEGSNEPLCTNEQGQLHPCLSPQDGTADQQSSNTPSSQEQTNAASPDEQKTILAMHNRARTAVGAPDLVWSDSLAADAANYLKKMVAHNKGMIFSSDPPGAPDGNMLRHDPDIKFGENLARESNAHSRESKVKPPSVESLLQGWLDEKSYLGGHYTQMVWKATKEVGCAIATVKGMTEGMHGVNVYLNCKYNPPGNVGQYSP